VWRELFTHARGAGAKARVNNSRHTYTLQNFYPRAYVVRHGHGEHHVRDIAGGWTDLPMTPLDQNQAIRLAAVTGKG